MKKAGRPPVKEKKTACNLRAYKSQLKEIKDKSGLTAQKIFDSAVRDELEGNRMNWQNEGLPEKSGVVVLYIRDDYEFGYFFKDGGYFKIFSDNELKDLDNDQIAFWSVVTNPRY